MFNLPVAESSLYVFNTVLCCLALLFTIKLFVDIFDKHLPKEVIIVLTTLLFAFQTEIMHGMGQVYWHQSLMQVLLPLQFLCFWHFEENKKWKIGYFALTVLMPYVEWTGFIANVGFAMALFFKHGIKIQKKDFLWAFVTGVCTIIALLLFCGHFLSVIDWNGLTGALRDRYHMRTTYSDATIFNLIWGYWKSFKWLWILLLSLGMGCVIINKGVKWIKDYLFLLPIFFVMSFPVIENIVMKDHAISYTYDRMKLVYPLMMLVFLFLAAVSQQKKWLPVGVIAIMLPVAGVNVTAYTANTEYIWSAEYRIESEKLAEREPRESGRCDKKCAPHAKTFCFHNKLRD